MTFARIEDNPASNAAALGLVERVENAGSRDGVGREVNRAFGGGDKGRGDRVKALFGRVVDILRQRGRDAAAGHQQHCVEESPFPHKVSPRIRGRAPRACLRLTANRVGSSSSGGINREQGIGKAGNRRLRTVMVELAWLWQRYQPGAAQVAWFRDRVGSTGRRIRKVMVVALARKLLIALWRFVIDGVMPEGAVMKPSI